MATRVTVLTHPSCVSTNYHRSDTIIRRCRYGGSGSFWSLGKTLVSPLGYHFLFVTIYLSRQSTGFRGLVLFARRAFQSYGWTKAMIGGRLRKSLHSPALPVLFAPPMPTVHESAKS